MTVHRSNIFALFFVLLIFIFSINAIAMNECPKLTPRDYQNLPYGDVLYSIEKPCFKTLTKADEVFMAGISHHLLKKCGYPEDQQSRSLLDGFLSSSISAANMGSEYGNPNLNEAMQSMRSTRSAWNSGVTFAEEMSCIDTSSKIAENIVNYLKLTRRSEPNPTNTVTQNYVDGCATQYSGRYSREQCQCLADLGSAVIPNLNKTAFYRESIKQITNGNPFVGLQIAMKCKITNY